MQLKGHHTAVQSLHHAAGVEGSGLKGEVIHHVACQDPRPLVVLQAIHVWWVHAASLLGVSLLGQRGLPPGELGDTTTGFPLNTQHNALAHTPSGAMTHLARLSQGCRVVEEGHSRVAEQQALALPVGNTHTRPVDSSEQRRAHVITPLHPTLTPPTQLPLTLMAMNAWGCRKRQRSLNCIRRHTRLTVHNTSSTSIPVVVAMEMSKA